MKKIQSIRGFNDIIDDIPTWQMLETTLRKLSSLYGYLEIRTPMLEESRLFERSIGVTSDIVNKEMYTFCDRNEQSVSLRPEGTASVVRTCIENNLLYDQARKWFYIGSMFRRERPQKGRLRQFHQFGMECLGYDEPFADIEQLMIINQIWEILELSSKPKLELNYIGTRETRQAYGAALKAYYEPYLDSMDELNQRRWRENTLRLLDSKDPTLIKINSTAPTIASYYTTEEQAQFDTIQSCCHDHTIPFTVQPSLMRGLDYYTGLIYEWKSDLLGAQSTVCGGGRYDLLFESLGEKKHGACGFSIGLERLIELCPTSPKKQHLTVHLATESTSSLPATLALSEKLRRLVNTHAYFTQLTSTKTSNLIKRAVKKDADVLVINNYDSIDEHPMIVKNLRDKSHQQMNLDELVSYLETLV